MMELSAPPLLALAVGVWLERKLMKQSGKSRWMLPIGLLLLTGILTVLRFRAAAGFERVSIPLLCRYHRLWFAGDRHWLADREDGWSGTPTGEK